MQCVLSVFIDYINKVSMSRRKPGNGDRQFNNVDYTQLTETDNGFVDSQVRYPLCTF